MTLSIRLAAVIAVVIFMLNGCGKQEAAGNGPDHDTSAGASHDDHGGEGDDDGDGDGDTQIVIELNDRERTEFGIEIATASEGVLSDTTSLVGEIVLNPDQVAHVVARAGGIGTNVYRTIGDRVEAGESLAVLESPELAESKAEYLSKAAQAALAATDLERAKTIHANTLQLLKIIDDDPDVDTLRSAISGLDIGANRGDLIMAYAELQATEAVYNREKTLYDRQISSESEYLSAESELKKALAAFQAMRDDLAFSNRREFDVAQRSKVVHDVSLQASERRLHALGMSENEVKQVVNETDTQLARYEIRSPIAGLIIKRHLVRGESLDAGEQIFVIADMTSVWGQLTLYQRDLAFVREGQTARIIGAHQLGDTSATIEYVSPILNEQTRTTTARVVLDNTKGNWRPGMFIRANLVSAQYAADVVIPRTALQEMSDETIIFVLTKDGLVPRDVTIGRRTTDSVEILEGLRPGEQYVVSGGLALKAELNKSALESQGHSH